MIIKVAEEQSEYAKGFKEGLKEADRRQSLKIVEDLIREGYRIPDRQQLKDELEKMTPEERVTHERHIRNHWERAAREVRLVELLKQALNQLDLHNQEYRHVASEKLLDEIRRAV